MIDQRLEIVFNRPITEDTFLMGLRSEEVVSGARPGHFVMIRVRTGLDPFLRRPFSICGTQAGNLFFILYRVVGKGTSLMAKTASGERISVLGPLGRGFSPPEAGGKPILVAGGIGIAPLIFLAQTVGHNEITFMAGHGSACKILDPDEMGLYRGKTQIATDDGTAGHSGPVTDLLESHMAGSAQDPQSILACGPMPMLKRVAALAKTYNILCQVSLEATMACGLGACQGCAVPAASEHDRAYYHVCRDGPVFNVRHLNWERF
jgi:dihydroorotate dehydrogenase electron transfer subunit